jgi:hypothetical protein
MLSAPAVGEELPEPTRSFFKRLPKFQASAVSRPRDLDSKPGDGPARPELRDVQRVMRGVTLPPADQSSVPDNYIV